VGVSAPRVLVFSEAEAVAQVAAGMVVESAKMAVHDRGRFLLALSGGSTPRRLYQILASAAYDTVVPWACMQVVFGDERCVSPGGPRSNYRLAADAGLLDRPLAAVHRMHGELPPEEGAVRYQEELAALDPVGESRTSTLPPRLDLILLGLGEDGHTASLFPGTRLLEERERWVAAAPGPDGLWRLTLTPAVLGRGRRLLFLVTGAAKAAPVARILAGAAPELPAARIMTQGERVTLLLDREAAALLPPA
jgi:6-phosphogluconolactonase